MKIAMVRVDERLIHGQITMSWTHTVGANLILCVNDEVAGNNFQKNLMKMAAPPGVKVEIEAVDSAAEKLNAQAWSNASILLMVRNPIDLLKLVKKGLSLEKVNIGGVRTAGATIKLNKVVLATPAELEAWKELDQMGIRLEIQFLPGEGITVL
ncbi:MAG TPA: PTS sugar transporter subunit IIB, partial [Longilinea sp.]|nr:PTS sugar transporter subunit IIB [Longilinea sp.]